MNHKHSLIAFVITLAVALLLSVGSVIAQEQGSQSLQSAIGTAFTYQGQLKNASGPVNDHCDFQFGVWEALIGGTSLAGDLTHTNVPVSQGLFTVQLDFGINVFNGAARWLEIAVRCPAGTGDYATLTPRQPLTPAPYALFSTSTGALQGRSIMTTTPISGQVLKWDGSVWSPAEDAVGAPGSGDISAVNAGYGLSGGGTNGDVTLAVVTSTIQMRVSGNCPAGSSIRVVNQNGTTICEVDDDTLYSAGAGLILDRGQFSVVTSTIQQRVLGACGSGNAIRVINQDGTVTCQSVSGGSGDISGVYAGNGLTGGGASGEVTLTVNYAGSGTATTAAHSDHNHWGAAWTGSGTGLSLFGGSMGLASSGTTTGTIGIATGTSGSTVGVYGSANSPGGAGVYGTNSNGPGIWGRSSNGNAMYGISTNGIGMYGYSSSNTGVQGYSYSGTGVFGDSSNGDGVYGSSSSSTGVYGTAPATGTVGIATGTSGSTVGVYGSAPDGYGVYGNSSSGAGVFGDSSSGIGVYGRSFSDFAGYFYGDVHVVGDLSATGTKPFKIDNPLDPAKQYLYHYAVESPQVQNMYNGTIVLDAQGEARVTLPDYFSAVNRGEFQYQLTALGAPMPNLYIAEELTGDHFKIAGGVAGKKVSWLIFGQRNDPWLRDHPQADVVDKPADEAGTYLYPQGYGQPETSSVDYAFTHPLAPTATITATLPRPAPSYLP